ncbi:hypothetical protein [Halobaculum rubrum]|uniref:hypothetical protein n=1 Tax=Halobaculum rubrum TaxID=2872158 RepID=UPI001CA3E29E|nr:hypothetical protein [Halobaculum rubrum]QZY01216.1 hypothetical protein K6T25_15260 [Halobaculum rubrum]
MQGFTDHYHDQLDDYIGTNGAYNDLIDYVDESYCTPCGELDRSEVDTAHADPSKWPEHDVYVSECQFCTLSGTCDSCNAEKAIARIDTTPCYADGGSWHTAPDVECDHCTISVFCPDCVAAHEDAHENSTQEPIATLNAEPRHSVKREFFDLHDITQSELTELGKPEVAKGSTQISFTTEELNSLTKKNGEPLTVEDLPPQARSGHASLDTGGSDEPDDVEHIDPQNGDTVDAEHGDPVGPKNDSPYESWTHDEPTQLVEHHECPRSDHGYEPSDCGMCETIVTSEPFTYLPVTAMDYFTGPNWESQATDDSIDSPNEARQQKANTIGRGWSEETVTDARVGYVPPKKTAGISHLIEEGHTVQQLLATGLFSVDTWDIAAELAQDSDDRDEVEQIEDVISAHLYADDEDEEATQSADGRDLWKEIRKLDPETVLKSRWRGRLFFPYFDADGKPIHALSRTMKARPHPNDTKSDAKYAKLPTYNHIGSEEPIYGVDSLRSGEPVVITEGIADAIAAHAHGIPCLSPVTVQFSDDDVSKLLDIIDEYDIPVAYVVQDNERAEFSWQDNSDADNTVDVDDDGRFGTTGGEINQWVEFDGIGPGERGALKTAKMLDDNGIGAFLIEIPRIAGRKVDLDDYLTDELYEVAPPLPHLSALLETWRRKDDEATLRETVGSAEVPRVSPQASTYTDGLSSVETNLLDTITLRRAFTSEVGQQITAYLEEHHGVGLDEEDEDVTVRERSAVEDDEATADQIPLRFKEFPHMDYAGSGLDEAELMEILEWDTEYGIPRVPIGEYIDFAEAKTAIVTADGAGWEDVVATAAGGGPEDIFAEDAGEEFRPPSLAKSGLGTYLTLGRHVAVRGSESLHRDVKHFGKWVDDSDDESGPVEVLTEPLFEAHTITHPTDHDAYDEFTKHRAVEQLDERRSDSDRPDLKSGSNSNRNEFYEQTITALTGHDVGERDVNPLAHIGDSENYFLPLKRDIAYDHKRQVTYTPLSYMACMVGVRRVDNPGGEFTDEEELHTWVRIKERTSILSDDAKIPWKLLNEAGLELGTLEPEDIQETEVPKENKTVTVDMIVDDQKFNATIDAFREEYGVDPGRSKRITEDDFLVDGVTKEESFEAFAEHHITDVKPDWDERDTNQATVKTKYAWAAYEEFCEVNGVDPRPQGDWPELVEEIGCEKKRMTLNSNRRRRLVGATLTPTGWMMKKRRLGSDGPRD